MNFDRFLLLPAQAAELQPINLTLFTDVTNHDFLYVFNKCAHGLEHVALWAPLSKRSHWETHHNAITRHTGEIFRLTAPLLSIFCRRRPLAE